MVQGMSYSLVENRTNVTVNDLIILFHLWDTIQMQYPWHIKRGEKECQKYEQQNGEKWEIWKWKWNKRHKIGKITSILFLVYYELPVKEFVKLHYSPHLQLYKWHWFQSIILSKQYVTNVPVSTLRFDDVATQQQQDFVEQSKQDFNS